MENLIALETIYGQEADGTPVEIIIEIGAPYEDGQYAGEWVCPLNMPILRYSDKKIRGGSALQALCLALSSIRMALTFFREEGGKLGYEVGEDNFDIDATMGISDLTRKP